MKRSRSGWRSFAPYFIGLALLIIPTAYLLNASHTIFRDECRQQCAAVGMDYKVRALARPAQDPIAYPAECRCVARAEKRWWEVWK